MVSEISAYFFMIVFYGIPALAITGVPSAELVAMTCYGSWLAVSNLRRKKLAPTLFGLLLAITPLALFALVQSYWTKEARHREVARAALRFHSLPTPAPTMLVVRHIRSLPIVSGDDAAVILERTPLNTIWVLIGSRDAIRYEWTTGASVDCAKLRGRSAVEANKCITTTRAFALPGTTPAGALELLSHQDSTLLP